MRLGAVLFDWRGTLVHYLDPPALVESALNSLSRPSDVKTVSRIVRALRETSSLPEFVESELIIDTSAELHRRVTMRMFERAGLDVELAEALYPADFDPQNHPLYPDVPPVLATLRELDVKAAVVSDIHFDLRPEFAAAGIADLIDAFVLSFEHGFQKPDRRMFELPLQELDVEPGEALMVGDTPSHDGGAAAVGITTVILPMLDRLKPRGLDFLLRLVK